MLADIKTIYNNDNNVFLLWFAFLFLQVRSAFKRMRQRQLLSRGSDNVSMFIGSVSCIIWTNLASEIYLTGAVLPTQANDASSLEIYKVFLFECCSVF